MKTIHRAAVVVLSLVALGLAGCAALRIDVDVYKGPFANHEDVQVRQYAVLAIAAQPVLASLRNQLETRKNPEFYKFLNENPNLRDVWIPEEKFQDETARFTNGALSFFKDAGNPQLIPYIVAARDAYKKYSFRLAELDNVSEESLQLASKLDEHYPLNKKPVSYLTAEDKRWRFGHLMAQYLRGESMPKGDASVCVGDRIWEHQYPPGKSLEKPHTNQALQCACRSLGESLGKMSGVDRSKLLTGAKSLSCTDTTSSNDFHTLLGKRETVTAYAQVLLGNADADFIDQTSKRSVAFLSSRESMHSLYQAFLSLIEKLGEIGTNEQLRAAGKALAETVQTKFLACHLAQSTYPINFDAKVKELLAINFPVTNSKWNEADYETAKRAVGDVVIKYPQLMIKGLREDELAFRNARNEQLNCDSRLVADDIADVSPHPSRLYGFARGPSLGTGFEKELSRLDSSLQGIVASSSAGFDKARPLLGIETLTTNFIASLELNGNDPRNPSVAKERKKLEESLVMWAERVLVVVNNRVLMQSISGSPVESQLKDEKKLGQDVAVLQAVANTIILHADDMRRRDAYEMRQQDRTGIEAAAVRRAFDLTPAQMIDQLLREIQGKIDLNKSASAPVQSEADAGGKLLNDEQRKFEDSRKELSTKQLELVKLTNAAATVKGSLLAPLDVPDGGAANDSKEIDATIKPMPPETTVQLLITKIETWLDDQIALLKLGVSTVRLKRLEGAKQYLAENKAALVLLEDAKDIDKSSATTRLEALKVLLMKNAVERAKEVNGLEHRVKQQEAAVILLEKQVMANAQAAKLEAERDILAEIRKEVLAKIDAKWDGDGRTVVSQMVDALNAKRKTSGITGAQKTAIDEALKTVRLLKPPMGLPYDSPKQTPPKTRKDVVDDLIASLRYQRARALAAGDTTNAGHLDAALERLYKDRADMAYLRPASVYLRSVYATTSVQADPEVGWVNMLSQNTRRAFGPDADSGYQEYLKTLSEIDKQHWQNVNTVSLAGGGNVNYVVAKDDVGNWYVKTYSADPGSIINSAQGLALFGIGKGLNLNLLRRAQLQNQLDSTDTPSEKIPEIKKELEQENQKVGGAGSSALSSVVDRYRADYETRTRSDAEKLQREISQLRDQILSAWSAGLDGVSKETMLEKLKEYMPDNVTELVSAGKELADVLAKEVGTPAERANNLSRAQIRALDAVRRMRYRVESAIKSDVSLILNYRAQWSQEKAALDTLNAASKGDSETAEEANKKIPDQEKKVNTAKEAVDNVTANQAKAAKVVVTVSNELIAKTVQSRLDAIKQLKTALTIVGQAGDGNP